MKDKASISVGKDVGIDQILSFLQIALVGHFFQK